MEYMPRFSQPFSLAEAINLDVAVITEEIARLQNSVVHLKETQTILQADLEESGPGEVDHEVAKAFEENKLVIGSQEERISILNMALAEKGIVSGSHYEMTATPPNSESEALQTMQTRGPCPNHSAATASSEDNGVYL